MNYWFECKIGYDKENSEGGVKKANEVYLVDALSFTEAEKRILEEMKPFASLGPIEVINIKRVRYNELFLNQRDEADRYYRAKVNMIVFDEKSGNEKRTALPMLIKAEDLPEAVNELTSKLEEMMGNYEIVSVNETLIMDIFAYGS